ncbi:hypothetical protein [Rhizobium sp. Leaf341]|uniref:hypothetical protein n=1 Tax=Rhizobium sp. Leaf341 TaxID=1736344 RepID=UPI000713825C|nr:hypothetical protein [Rhizobium sp. Leaf341]KQR67968.1 hypothetical protein ASG03_10735 [Rhizobium sp. Leaf341]
MVSAVLVVMTILGCDDSVSQCHYVDTVKGSWETVAACDSQSQKKLPAYTNASYPVIVAMCEKTGDAPIAADAESRTVARTTLPPTVATPSTAPTVAPSEPSPTAPSPRLTPAPSDETALRKPLPERAYAMLRGVLPDGQKIRHAISVPVHYLGDGYSWVATRIAR